MHDEVRKVPFTMLWAKPSRDFGQIEGEYDFKSQKWSMFDVNSATTWSRTSTTGWINLDPDEDKDD